MQAEQQAKLGRLAQRTAALSVGRGMFTLNSKWPLLTEPISIPPLVMDGKVQRNSFLALSWPFLLHTPSPASRSLVTPGEGKPRYDRARPCHARARPLRVGAVPQRRGHRPPADCRRVPGIGKRRRGHHQHLDRIQPTKRAQQRARRLLDGAGPTGASSPPPYAIVGVALIVQLFVLARGCRVTCLGLA